jgi:spore germination protein YaaH
MQIKIPYKKPPSNFQYGPKPQVDYDPIIEDQENRVKVLEQMVGINVVINMILGGLIIFLIIFVIAIRFNLVNYFQKSTTQNLQKEAVAEEFAVVQTGLGEEESGDSQKIYINQQGIDIAQAFEGPQDNFKLTLNGPVKKEVLGFLPYWVLPEADKINLNLVTAVSYFGLDVDAGGNIIKSDTTGKPLQAWTSLQNDPNFEKFVKRAKNNKTKVYLTIKCFDQSAIVALVTNDAARKNFISNAMYLLNAKSFDGINLDFEYIGTPSEQARDGFSLLVTNLNKEMKRQYPKAELTVDTFVDAASKTRINDVAVLAANSDALVIMGYDFHTPNSDTAGAVSPMQGGGYSLFGFLSSYLEKAPPEKIILALPYYGYDWPVVSASNKQVTGTRADVRILTYADIINSSKGAQINWDNDAQSPWYVYKDLDTKQNRIVYFENTRSLGVKYDFITQKNLKGVGIWALGYDGNKKDLVQLLSDKFSY